jgi:periplasmic divalent cation tolerance protein
MVLVYTTCPSAKVADRIGTTLLRRRLVACYNTWSIRSRYRWHGTLTSSREVALLLKTTPPRVREVRRLTEELHPDEAPCLVAIAGRQFNAAYRRWLAQTCR